MSQVIAQIAIGASTAVAVALTVRNLRNRRGHGEWTMTSWAIVVVGWLFAVASSLAVVLGFVTTGNDVTGAPIRTFTLPGYEFITHLGNYVLIGGAVALAGWGFWRYRQINAVALIFLAAAFVGALADMSSGGGSPISKPRLILFAVILAVAFLRPRGAALGAAVFGLSTAFVSGLSVLTDYQTATYRCGQSKCGPLGILYFGVTTNENLFGLVLTGSIPAVFIAFRHSSMRWWLIAYLLLTTWFTGSRTSTIGALVTVAACLLTGSDPGRTQRRRAWGWFIISVGVVIGIVLPFSASNPAAFTNRAGLWIIARSLLSGHWGAGLGGDYWSTLYQAGVVQVGGAGYSVHNQWLDVIFDSGVIGFVIFAVGLIALTRYRAGLLLLVPVVYLGITERANLRRARRLSDLGATGTYSVCGSSQQGRVLLIPEQQRNRWRCENRLDCSATAVVTFIAIAGISPFGTGRPELGCTDRIAAQVC